MAVINVDGSCYQHRCHAGWAVEVKGYTGTYTKSGALLTSSPLVAEEVALYQGYAEALKIPDQKITIHSDCKGLVDKLRKYHHTEQDLFLKDIVELQKAGEALGKTIRLLWLRRTKIGCVHHLAKEQAKKR